MIPRRLMEVLEMYISHGADPTKVRGEVVLKTFKNKEEEMARPRNFESSFRVLSDLAFDSTRMM